MEFNVVVLAFETILGGILYLVYRARYRRMLQPLGGLFDAAGAEVEGVLSGKLVGRYGGREASIGVRPGRSSRWGLSVRLACRSTLAFEVRLEGARDVLAEELRGLDEVDEGRRRLNTSAIFSCREPARFVRWLRDRAARGAIVSLVRRRSADSLRLRGGGLELRRERLGETDLDVDRIRKLLHTMEGLVRTIEAGT